MVTVYTVYCYYEYMMRTRCTYVYIDIYAVYCLPHESAREQVLVVRSLQQLHVSMLKRLYSAHT